MPNTVKFTTQSLSLRSISKCPLSNLLYGVFCIEAIYSFLSSSHSIHCNSVPTHPATVFIYGSHKNSLNHGENSVAR